MRTGFWTTDWFLAAVISLGLGLAAWLASDQVERWELMVYDLGRGMASPSLDERISLISIDARSVEALGRWPWSRNHDAALIDFLERSGASVVASTVPLSRPHVAPGLAHIEQLTKTYARAGVHIPGLGRQLMQARQDLDTDTRLATSVHGAGNVVLGVKFRLGDPGQSRLPALPEYLDGKALEHVPNPRAAAWPVDRPPLAHRLVAAPIPEIGQHARLVGHVNWLPDADGVHRGEPLVVDYGGRYFPSLALAIAAASLGAGPETIALDAEEGVRVGDLKVRTDSNLQMRPKGFGLLAQSPAFPVDSFSEVLAGRVSSTRYRDKIVLIGFGPGAADDPEVSAQFPAGIPHLSAIAHSVAGILDEALIVAPESGRWLTLAAFVAVCLYLVVLLPRLRAAAAMAATGGAVAFLALLELGLLALGLWIKLLIPIVVLAVGYLALVAKRLAPQPRPRKLKSQAPPAESNRMLGLAHQGNGDLDAAYACFRNLPVDESVMDLLYNLALDFEQVTSDHSLLQELVDKGFYTAEEAKRSLNKNLVTRALGIDLRVNPDVQEDFVEPGDIYLLCSDGLSDEVDDACIHEIIRKHEDDIEEAATSLVELANERGGQDNISVILARTLGPLPSKKSWYDRMLRWL